MAYAPTTKAKIEKCAVRDSNFRRVFHVHFGGRCPSSVWLICSVAMLTNFATSDLNRLFGSPHFLLMKIAQESTESRSDKSAALPQKNNLNRFLKSEGETALWLEDSLARWQRSNDPTVQFERSLEISLWLEKELAIADVSIVQEEYPQLWDGPHATGEAFACIRLVLARQRLAALAAQAFQEAFNEKNVADSAPPIADLQREFRGIVDALVSHQTVAGAESTVTTIRRQQLDELAKSGLAWTSYYQWLLQDAAVSEAVPKPALKEAKQIFMQLLNVSEPDLRASDFFRWFDSRRGAAADHLFGLGLICAAQGELLEANTCFATLKQNADAGLSLKIVLWLAQNLLKQGRHDEAQVLVGNYLIQLSTEDNDFAIQAVQTMLGWSPPDVGHAEWRWRLLELLVQRGQIEEATQLLLQQPVSIPAGILSGQVLRLSQLVTDVPLAARSVDERKSLIAPLESWAAGDSRTGTGGTIPRGVRQWAEKWLLKVMFSLGRTVEARQIAERVFRDLPSENLELRQDLAWQLAASYESEAEGNWAMREPTIRWYREVLSHGNTARNAVAEVKIRLWELADQPLAQVDYLRSISSAANVHPAMERQLIAKLYAQLLALAHDPAAQRPLAEELQQLIAKQLGLSLTLANPLQLDEWQEALLDRIGRFASQDEVSMGVSLLTVWVHICEWDLVEDAEVIRHALLRASSRHVADNPEEYQEAWTPLLVSAITYWGQQATPIDELQITMVDVLLKRQLLPVEKNAVLASFVPRLQQQWDKWLSTATTDELTEDAIRKNPQAIKLSHLCSEWFNLLEEEPGLDEQHRIKTEVSLYFSEILWRQGHHESAFTRLEGVIGDERHTRQKARILSSLGDPNGEKLWRECIAKFSPGNAAWFEARYQLLVFQAKRSNPDAKRAYQQLRQLYLQIPQPWSDKFEELAKQQQW